MNTTKNVWVYCHEQEADGADPVTISRIKNGQRVCCYCDATDHEVFPL